jgi:hypothetical protein
MVTKRTSKAKAKAAAKSKAKSKPMRYGVEKLNRIYQVVFLVISVLFLIIGAVIIVSGVSAILGIQFLITSILFSKANRKLSEKKISIDFKDDRTRSLFVIGFIFSIVGLSMNIGVWAIGVILFSLWLFGK